MRKILFIILLLFINSAFASEGNSRTNIIVLNVEGVIDPVTTEYIKKGIAFAEETSAEALIIQIDTPGGLDAAMRSIIQSMLDSGVPVIVYVYPSGARAASAGSFILIASHLAAMAPGTNAGAAHPVAIGIGSTGEVSEKVVNDAAAYMKSLAEQQGRNAEIAASFVYNSTSLTSTEALNSGIIDVAAESYDSLLSQLDGMEVKLKTGTKILRTQNAELVKLRMNAVEEFLHIISNPTIAYILFLAGVYGIIFELSNPSTVLPGVIGGICIILAFWSFQALSISATGIALIIFAAILFIAEIHSPTQGILTAGGIISLILGSIMLINAEKEPYARISLQVIIAAAVITALFFIFAIGLTIKTQHKKSTTGMEGMIGEIGTAKTELSPEGTVFVHSELWKARANKTIQKGRKVKVVGVENLTLIVEEV